ncbi:fused isobutyryl-CoA mutase/GTPase IcmF [Mechercharimyces sp. CAU 1602]|uniref:fused isobutyryl-CoA mutase/GTPase IcmF n=1 Tax=Mechercharimyces sp. CAU 1602 TaxID=2973933 RepID=UPI002162B3FB|nr:fused isobutyryl-CoA mutase/GTPase IcmF [Mechercharimyces sp. CAU 1602]MCS1352346.1 methylmalonyl-CoA mutase family protein [Mechercharimyces sp. CAU 1602]
MKKERVSAQHPIRFLTSSSLFDGHDASINLFRRLLQAAGVEVIHMGHNRSVDEVVSAAIQEDVQGIAVSSYQGGHMEYFRYMIDLLRERGAAHIQVFSGGGGVIVPHEVRELEEYGVNKVFTPEDGRTLGLEGIVSHMIRSCDFATVAGQEELELPHHQRPHDVAKWITLAEYVAEDRVQCPPFFAETEDQKRTDTPVVGITGTGGAGKSSLTDELILRFVEDYPTKKLAILSIDPSKQKTGGALLGDRIRMNAVHHPHVYMRSLATRRHRSELSLATRDAIKVLQAAEYDLILVETSGIGQGDADIIEISNLSMYVMTAEYGAPSQLEKIEMLDYADMIAINKFDRAGSLDALRDVKKQYRRNHERFEDPDEEIPVYGTMASRFHDEGINRLYMALLARIEERFQLGWSPVLGRSEGQRELSHIIPPERTFYLRDISNTVRSYRQEVEEQAQVARRLFQLQGTQAALLEDKVTEEVIKALQEVIAKWEAKLNPHYKTVLDEWEAVCERYRQAEYVVKVRDREIVTPLYTETLAGTKIPKISLPRFQDWGEILRWNLLEGVPGRFPYTAGVFPLKRQDEDPKRQFAGEGTPTRTNRRFHYLTKNDAAKRLSTAFDSVTLYGEDPDHRPDIYGKIGESGVSICTLEDMRKLYDGFDLCEPLTSVSMTINGPAPILLAMFFNTAIEQQLQKFAEREGRAPTEAEEKEIRAWTLKSVRGTVQADILKEDQGQNTCIFSTEFAMKMMGDIQQYFIDHEVRNYYSVSISGYHIAEAGANPISQLAFTLSNAFTYVEYYLSRGMAIDHFAPNLSFFFSNGLDAEYTVIGRVARRVWAVVMKKLYGGNERSQKLKYHIQTSGRSLHAQEVQFNDIRTTLQALLAIYDQCNSLHTNAYDEAITTPTEESVRRAMAIQMIITKELGLAKNENSLQGAFIIEELTDLVEEAVLQEFERISDRGGVLGAMERQYQRGKIQEESLYYETKKHNGELPIIGVNTFINPEGEEEREFTLTRADEAEKEEQITHLQAFHAQHADESQAALAQLKEVARAGGNLFAELMETVKVASLGQITHALYEVGGQYRRNM